MAIDSNQQSGNVFSRSWNVTKLTFSVMNLDKEIFLYPILASIISIIFIILMFLPYVVLILLNIGDLNKASFSLGVWNVIYIILTYFGLAFIGTFFSVCVVYTAKKRFENGNATFFESIGFAFSRIHKIFLWSLLAATVGILLRLLDNLGKRSGRIGQFIIGAIRSLLSMAWNIITIFVVPAIVFYDLGPFSAIKKSIEVLKKTWGESLIRYIGLGLMHFLFILFGILIALLFIVIGVMTGNIALVLIFIFLFIIYVVIVSLVFDVATKVFNTALFIYADTGKIPKGFDSNTIKNAFRQSEKPKSFGFMNQ